MMVSLLSLAFFTQVTLPISNTLEGKVRQLLPSPTTSLFSLYRDAEKRPMRQAKTHYALVQRWVENDANGKPQDREEKICEGDSVAPVYDLTTDGSIPTQEFINVDCYASPKPGGAPTKTDDLRQVRMNFFVIFMDVDIFGTEAITKNFVTFVRTVGHRNPTTGFSSSNELALSQIAYPLTSKAGQDEHPEWDASEYTVAARFTDYGPPPPANQH